MSGIKRGSWDVGDVGWEGVKGRNEVSGIRVL